MQQIQQTFKMNSEKENENSKQFDREQLNKQTNQSKTHTKSIKSQLSQLQKVDEYAEQSSQNNSKQLNSKIQNDQQCNKLINLVNDDNSKLNQQEKHIEINETIKDQNQISEQQYCFLNDKSTNQYALSKELIENLQETFNKQKIDNACQQNKIRKKQMNIKYIIDQFPIFSKSNRLILLWDLIVNIFMVILLFFIPISFIYEKPLQSYLTQNLQIIIPLVMLLDVLVCCNTFNYDKGKKQKNRSKILKDYVTNNFVSDIFPIIIYFIVGYVDSTNISVRIILLLFFTKIIQIWRIFKNIKESIFLSKPLATIMQLTELFCFIITVSHVLACIWLFIGLKSDQFTEQQWITKSQIDTAGWQTQYISSYYFVIVSIITVGYGDITATNSIEMIFAIIIIMIGCGIFGYTLSQLGKTKNSHLIF